MRSSHLSIFELDMPDGRLETCRPTLINFWEMLGYDLAEAPTELGAAAALVLTPDDVERVPSAINAYLSGAIPRFELEHQVRKKDGSLEWRLTRGVAVRDERGTPTRLIGSHVDITDRKELERELRHAKERLELALLGSRACAWDLELTNGAVEDSRTTFTNLWELLGYEPAEHSPPLADILAILVHAEDQAPLALSIQSCLDGRGREWEQEFRARHKDGSVRWQLARGVVQREDTSGRALRFTGSIVDITDRKLAEKALRKSEERFRLTFDNAAVGMAISNEEGRFTACNEKASELIGYS